MNVSLVAERPIACSVRQRTWGESLQVLNMALGIARGLAFDKEGWGRLGSLLETEAANLVTYIGT